jgi:hypothetical protein
MIPELETERMWLRPVRLEDANSTCERQTRGEQGEEEAKHKSAVGITEVQPASCYRNQGEDKEHQRSLEALPNHKSLPSPAGT